MLKHRKKNIKLSKTDIFAKIATNLRLKIVLHNFHMQFFNIGGNYSLP